MKEAQTAPKSTTTRQDGKSAIALPAPGAGLLVQPKLMVGHPNDPLEHEADRAAERVVSLWQGGGFRQPPGDAPTPSGTPLIQRRAASPAAGAVQASPQISSQIETARGGGQALPATLQPSLEAAFGMDFSGVRLHTDARADALNRDLQARAFTTGRDIFFREGAYQPHTVEGVRLLGHELGHVGQQGEGMIQRDVITGEYVRERLRRLEIRLTSGQERHARQEELERGSASARIVSGISNLYGWTQLPQYRIWHNAINLLRRARTSIQLNSFDQANQILDAAESSIRRAYGHLHLHIDRTIEGAESAESASRGIQIVSTTVVSAINPAAGILFGAELQIRQQATEVSYGLRDNIDWAGIGFDTVTSILLNRGIGAITQRLGGSEIYRNFVRSLARRIARHPRFAEFSVQQLLPRIRNVIQGRLSSIIQSSIRLVFDRARGERQSLTWRDFTDAVVGQVYSNEAAISILMDILLPSQSRRRSPIERPQTPDVTVPGTVPGSSVRYREGRRTESGLILPEATAVTTPGGRTIRVDGGGLISRPVGGEIELPGTVPGSSVRYREGRRTESGLILPETTAVTTPGGRTIRVDGDGLISHPVSEPIVVPGVVPGSSVTWAEASRTPSGLILPKAVSITALMRQVQAQSVGNSLPVSETSPYPRSFLSQVQALPNEQSPTSLPGGFLERGVAKFTPTDRPFYVVRVGGESRNQLGRFFDYVSEDRSEAVQYANSLATRGEEAIRRTSALPLSWHSMDPGNPVERVYVFEGRTSEPTLYIQGVVGPQIDPIRRIILPGGGPQAAFPRLPFTQVYSVPITNRQGRGLLPIIPSREYQAAELGISPEQLQRIEEANTRGN